MELIALTQSEEHEGKTRKNRYPGPDLSKPSPEPKPTIIYFLTSCFKLYRSIDKFNLQLSVPLTPQVLPQSMKL
jgi:hypothetical protein